MILKAVPEAEVKGTVGRKSSFEVVVNGVLVFSKLKKGKFPDFNERGLMHIKYIEAQTSSNGCGGEVRRGNANADCGSSCLCPKWRDCEAALTKCQFSDNTKQMRKKMND
ncbi:UNVERIFIED_CONTAM: hypothetical protein NCL1_31945 [Trichonephila clavipes]